jgi:hypothetical protein
MGAIAELLIPGAFLVDIIPILKHVPEWFPGAKFYSSHNAKTCSKDSQYNVCSDRGINGM